MPTLNELVLEFVKGCDPLRPRLVQAIQKRVDKEIFKEILWSKCTDVNAAGEDGITAIIAAIVVESKEPYYRERLMQHSDLDINKTDLNGNGPLHYATILGRSRAVEALLKCKDINRQQPNKRGVIPSFFTISRRSGRNNIGRQHGDLNQSLQCQRKIHALYQKENDIVCFGL